MMASCDDLEASEPTMYIFVNMDLKMGTGKIASQVGHVVGEMVHRILTRHDISDEIKRVYNIWRRTGQRKIVVKANYDQLVEIMKLPESIEIIDAGRTQIKPDSLTVVGCYPSLILSKKFKPFKLL